MHERVTTARSLTHSLSHWCLRFHLACHPLPLVLFCVSAFHLTGLRRPFIKGKHKSLTVLFHCAQQQHTHVHFEMGILDVKPSVLLCSCGIINTEWIFTGNTLFYKHIHTLCFRWGSSSTFPINPSSSVSQGLPRLAAARHLSALLWQNSVFKCVCVCV